MFEWYWNQPNVPHVDEFVDAIKKKTGRVPTARTWFGFVVGLDLRARRQQGEVARGASKMAKALQGFKLPPEVALMPNGRSIRAGQNQLIADRSSSAMRRPRARRPDDLFKVDQGRQGRRSRRHARGDRLQDDLADLTRRLTAASDARRPRSIAARVAVVRAAGETCDA